MPKNSFFLSLYDDGFMFTIASSVSPFSPAKYFKWNQANSGS